MTKALTDRLIASLKPDPTKRIQIADGGCPNLSLLVHTGGTKTWIWRGRVGGRIVKKAGAAYPVMSLAAARDWAIERSRSQVSGVVPQSVRETRKQVAKEAAGVTSRTVSALFDRYMTDEGNAMRACYEKRRIFDREFKPTLGDRQISTITYEDIATLINAKSRAGRPAMSNSMHVVMSRFCKWAVTTGRVDSGLKSNPYADGRKLNPEKKRDRFLDDAEIRLFWKATEVIEPRWRDMFRLLLLTGARRSEIAEMPISEIDLTSGTWSIPGTRTKNGKPHQVVLAPLALTMVKRLAKDAGESPWLFPAEKDKTKFRVAFPKLHGRVMAEMVRLKGSDVEPFVIHDLRRSAATGMAKLGIPVVVIEMALNHISGAKGGIVGNYQLYQYRAERADALAKWAKRVAVIVA